MTALFGNWKYVIIAAAILVFAYLLSFILRRMINRFIQRNADNMRVNPTNYSLLKNMISLIIYTGAVITIVYMIPQLRSLGTTLFASAGIAAAVLAFASQEAFSNIISGIFIVMFKPFRVGDQVELGDLKAGVVEDITLRHTVIRDFQNRRIIVPNTIISKDTIINSHLEDEMICSHVWISVSYDTNLDHAISIIQEVAGNHPDCLDNRSAEDLERRLPKVIVRVMKLGEYSVDLRAGVWAANPEVAFAMRSDLYKEIKARFQNEGIEIPFPHRTIVYKNQTPDVKEKQKTEIH